MVTLWAIQGTAWALEDCRYPAGGRHAFIGFVADPDRELATARMGEFLAGNGWRDVDFKRSGTIAADLSTVTSDVLRAAARSALDEGCGLVIYADAIEHADSGSRQ